MADKLELLKEQEKILRKQGKKQELGFVLGSQSEILAQRGDVRGALKQLEEAEKLFREAGHTVGREKSLYNQVAILRQANDPKALLAVLGRQEEIYRASGEDDELAECLRIALLTAHDLGDFKLELAFAEKLLPVRRRLGDRAGEIFCLGVGAMSLLRTKKGDLEKALRMSLEGEEISRTLNAPLDLARILNTKALVLQAKGSAREALAAALESYGVAEKASLSEWMRMNQPLIAALMKATGSR